MDALRAQFPATDFTLFAVILGLPLLGAFVNGVFGKRLGKKGVRLMALSAVGGAFLASVLTFLLLPKDGRLMWNAWRWFTITGKLHQNIHVDVAFSVDAMSGVMALVVTGVGWLIHLYASEYMREDPSYHRFFAYLNLFIFAMSTLILADNLVVMFVGWEGVGFCSYLLIGFWFTEEKNATAGKKAFIVNRIGDFGLILAMSLLVYHCGSLRMSELAGAAGNLLTPVKIWPVGNLSPQTLPSFLGWIATPDKTTFVYASTLVGLAVFLGAAGKSAQMPLYVWLPDAMAGPTPVSALIHAATMVTAGVYLVARLSFVFVLSPAAMATVATVGALTAIFAASIGLFQNDLKKVLAYSTVSQLGFMFIGVGVGAFSAGFFHVFTHAFFKACLFLGAGSVIHAMHARIHDTDKSQDMRHMGGLRKYMPITHATFLISCLAIAGVPPFAGFWSKDEILWKAYSMTVTTHAASSQDLPMWLWPSWLGPAIYWVGIAAATMTAFYMFRAYFLTFHGEFRGWNIVAKWKAPKHGHHDEHHDHHDGEGPIERPADAESRPTSIEGPAPHESPLAMTVPLMVLAAFAIGAGFLNAELLHVTPLGHALDPLFGIAQKRLAVRPGTEHMEHVMLAPGIGAFVVGGGVAYYVYQLGGGAMERSFATGYPRLYKLIYDKWRIDELYDATVVGMVDALADIFVMADTWIVDGILAKLTAVLAGFLGTVLRALQTGRVQAYSAAMIVGLAVVGWFMVQPHATISADTSALIEQGNAKLTAAPGFGYKYKWEAPGVADSKDFSGKRELTVSLKPGEKKAVKLHVESAFHSVTTQTIEIERPKVPGVPGLDFDPSQIPIPTIRELPTGPIPMDKIPDLIAPPKPKGGIK